ncbi:hypothetical protein SAMN02745724_02744 [Pseudoalteromonas denitrificans DSM 6059]|uniref:Uncharacterized protein n=1 Tax=Pseudoalteromonas denitrificans DSM 6059 TaxID=1123010 RepID=A0A1I1MM15_9GAMM|nr:hypothetical protein SAMN02745724_02744 [Pseudoalteromonas denitrificans DSM 6059]
MTRAFKQRFMTEILQEPHNSHFLNFIISVQVTFYTIDKT